MGSVTDCGANGRAFQGCVRFKKLEDLALDVVGRTIARMSAEEHMANYQAARALLGKANSAVTRVKERLTTASPRPGFPVTACVANGRAFKGFASGAAAQKKGAKKSAVKDGAKGMSD